MKESPDLFNYIAQYDESFEKLNFADNTNDINMVDSDFLYLTESQMKQSIKQGNYFQGKIMFQPNNLNTAIVKVHLFDKDVIVDNPERLNRVYNNDLVCLEILNEKCKNFFKKLKKIVWLTNKKNIEFDGNLLDEDNLDADDIQTADNELNEQQLNIKEQIESSKKIPVGRIRGIMKKTRTQFCGTIMNKNDIKEKKVNNISEELYINATKNNFEIFIPIDPKFPNFFVKFYKPELYYNKRRNGIYENRTKLILISNILL